MEIPELIPITISALTTGWKWLKENKLDEEAITAGTSLKTWIIDRSKSNPETKKAVEKLEVTPENMEARKLLSDYLSNLLDNQPEMTKELVQKLTLMEVAGKKAGSNDFKFLQNHNSSGDNVDNSKEIKLTQSTYIETLNIINNDKRDNENTDTTVKTKTCEVEIIINREYASFSDVEKNHIIKAVASIIS
jgi:hypothetical protein